jgi:hypothetical protein
VRYLFAGVVKGIGDYGNCVGIPTVGGEVYFDAAYEGNPLVNAMAIGLMKKEELIKGVAEGVGNPIMAVGSKTGRDGIHGATFASAELSEESEAKRPMVQVGDPFTEKLLLEASLELIRSGHIVGIQDMGAAGLVSSSTEMAARGGTGVDHRDHRVPVRETGMTPYEILLSETQERMLVVAKQGHEDEVKKILGKWDLDAEVVGHVTDTGRYACGERHGRRRHPRRAAGQRLPHVHARGRRERRDRPPAARVDAIARAAPRSAIPPGRWSPARLADDRLEALDLRAVRQHGAHQHRGGPRLGRRGAAAARHEEGDRRDGRLQRPLRVPEPARGGRSPSPRRRATWSARRNCRARSPTTSTSATR